MNTFKTYFLMTLLTVLVVLAGDLLGGQGGMMMAFLFAIAMNFGSYYFSDKIVLRMYGAREVTEGENPQLYRITRELAQRGGIPMPKLYIINGDQPNAFATGRNPEHAAVAVTEGIQRLLTPEELRGVIGHELGHVMHRDILIGTIAATFAGAITMLAHMAQWAMIFGGGRSRDDDEGSNPIVAIAMIIVAPLAAMLIQMAISRSREFMADEEGARLAANPLLLASALRKLQMKAEEIPMDASPSTAHMFIVNPLSGGGIAKLFSTHPPMEERVARLEAMVYGGTK
ncbi:MAG: zinc metalloprotease HtpX [Ignavibacteriales bacterium]|nr:zinc metalloprotease HtpX [Ignavibacteriales bacterium]